VPRLGNEFQGPPRRSNSVIVVNPKVRFVFVLDLVFVKRVGWSAENGTSMPPYGIQNLRRLGS
jgi:hypothetical protein